MERRTKAWSLVVFDFAGPSDNEPTDNPNQTVSPRIIRQRFRGLPFGVNISNRSTNRRHVCVAKRFRETPGTQAGKPWNDSAC